MSIPQNHKYVHKDISLMAASVLWRYMDFPKFAALLLNKALFFSRLSLMEDPFEGVITQPDFDYIKKNVEAGSSDERQIRKWISNIKIKNFVNCWHLNDGESAAMWSLYGIRGQSIAITTQLEHMDNLLPHFVSRGAVAYIDHDKDPFYSKQRLGEGVIVLAKRKSFEHEKELRFFFSEQDIIGVDFNLFKRDDKETGYHVMIDPSKFIQDIYVDPRSQPWMFNVVRDLANQFGLSDRVRRSKLLDAPAYLDTATRCISCGNPLPTKN